MYTNEGPANGKYHSFEKKSCGGAATTFKKSKYWEMEPMLAEIMMPKIVCLIMLYCCCNGLPFPICTHTTLTGLQHPEEEEERPVTADTQATTASRRKKKKKKKPSRGSSAASGGTMAALRRREQEARDRSVERGMARQLDELYDLRDQHNDLLMNILGEEQEAEAQREGLLASVPAGNERTRTRMEEEFAGQRAKASERILWVTTRFEEILRAVDLLEAQMNQP
uniref:Uncharacterized protein n=1 Tax=Heterosigma akashiwo TaxID=2829 RepID=A0A7S3XMT6_HETAK